MAAVVVMTAVNVNAQGAGDWNQVTRIGGNMSAVSYNDDAKRKVDYSVALGGDPLAETVVEPYRRRPSLPPRTDEGERLRQRQLQQPQLHPDRRQQVLTCKYANHQSMIY